MTSIDFLILTWSENTMRQKILQLNADYFCIQQLFLVFNGLKRTNGKCAARMLVLNNRNSFRKLELFSQLSTSKWHKVIQWRKRAKILRTNMNDPQKLNNKIVSCKSEVHKQSVRVKIQLFYLFSFVFLLCGWLKIRFPFSCHSTRVSVLHKYSMEVTHGNGVKGFCYTYYRREKENLLYEFRINNSKWLGYFVCTNGEWVRWQASYFCITEIRPIRIYSCASIEYIQSTIARLSMYLLEQWEVNVCLRLLTGVQSFSDWSNRDTSAPVRFDRQMAYLERISNTFEMERCSWFSSDSANLDLMVFKLIKALQIETLLKLHASGIHRSSFVHSTNQSDGTLQVDNIHQHWFIWPFYIVVCVYSDENPDISTRTTFGF